MSGVVSASGYTNVILVLNMKRFIAVDDQDRFETIRGTQDFASVLRTIWPEKCAFGNVFQDTSIGREDHNGEHEMTTEEIGFATGVFRSPYLEEHTFPTYKVNKELFPFGQYLRENLQFTEIFWKVWEKWDIYIRPTSTGMFVIRLLHKYPKPVSTSVIASRVVELQSSLDIKSARNKLATLHETFADDPETLKNKEATVLELLRWLGANGNDADSIKYMPVQWKIAMEVAGKMIQEVGYRIPVGDEQAIQLRIPPPRLSNPLHDSFVVHHIDELITSRKIVPRFNTRNPAGAPNKKSPSGHSADTQVTILANDIRESTQIQQQLVNLIEGSILLRTDNERPENSRKRRIFPTLEKDYMQKILGEDMASWTNELCLLSDRAAIFYPARNLRTDELLISTLPSTTSRVMYIRYWGAIERMIEFVLEIRVLAQWIERASYKLLGNFATTMQEARQQLLRGDIKLDREKSIRLVTDATHVRRLAALCQGLGNPQTWSRAEYATSKARHLFEKMGLPQLLVQIDRNIDSVNSAVDHLDELVLADLAEDSNDISFVLTLGLAAFSLLLTILIIPSFWADLPHGHFLSIPNSVSNFVDAIGNVLSILSIITAIAISLVVAKQANRIRGILKKFLWK